MTTNTTTATASLSMDLALEKKRMADDALKTAACSCKHTRRALAARAETLLAIRPDATEAEVWETVTQINLAMKEALACDQEAFAVAMGARDRAHREFNAAAALSGSGKDKRAPEDNDSDAAPLKKARA